MNATIPYYVPFVDYIQQEAQFSNKYFIDDRPKMEIVNYDTYLEMLEDY